MPKLGAKTLLFLGLLTFGISSCKKDAPTPGSPDPVFMVDYQLDNQAETKTAGKGGLYLFTDAKQGEDLVWSFSGSFADAACPDADCPGTLSFFWRNLTPGPALDTIWQTGLYQLYTPGSSDTALFRITMSYANNSHGNAEHFWLLNDQITFDGPEFIYETSDLQLHVYHSAQYPDGLLVESSQEFFPKENIFCLQTAIEAKLDIDTVDIINLTALPQPVGNYQYQWNTGDTLDSIQSTWQPDGSYAVSVSKPGGGCASITTLSNIPETLNFAQSGQIEANSIPLPSLPKGGPIIEWIDQQGLRWRSDRGQQLFPGNFFEILEVQDYEKNENGLPTKWLRIKWNCRLFNDAGDSRQMSGSGIIAVGWPG